MDIEKNWNTLKYSDIQELNNANLVLHQAVQFIALAGRYLIKQEADDSNTTMQWNSAENNFVGNIIKSGQNARIGINATELELQILNIHWKVLSFFPLIGQTKKEGFRFLKETLEKMSVNTGALINEMHYTLPGSTKLRNNRFEIANQEALFEIANQRSNAELVINYFAQKFSTASNVRIWPHHFDTGSFIPINQEDEVTKSIGIGYGIKDEYVDQPYFYLTCWSKKNLDITSLPKLSEGGIWNTKDWIGACLPVSALNQLDNAKDQVNLTNNFFYSAISAAIQLFGENETYKQFVI